jgi:hypothetical protein
MALAIDTDLVLQLGVYYILLYLHCKSIYLYVSIVKFLWISFDIKTFRLCWLVSITTDKTSSKIVLSTEF